MLLYRTNTILTLRYYLRNAQKSSYHISHALQLLALSPFWSHFLFHMLLLLHLMQFYLFFSDQCWLIPKVLCYLMSHLFHPIKSFVLLAVSCGLRRNLVIATNPILPATEIHSRNSTIVPSISHTQENTIFSYHQTALNIVVSVLLIWINMKITILSRLLKHLNPFAKKTHMNFISNLYSTACFDCALSWIVRNICERQHD